jgi:toxin CptA
MKPLHINFKPSYQLTALFVAMGVAMCAILIPLPFSWQIKLAVVIIVITCVSYATAAVSLLILPRSCVALQVNVKNELEIIRNDGSRLCNLLLSRDSVVSPYLTVMRYQQKNAPFWQRVFKASIIILPDSTDAESFRQLRIWLRWGN